MYQMIAFDMDGTLLRSDQTIDPRSLAAIERASQAGKTVVLATGRSLSELRTYLPQLPTVSYGVLASGGLLVDLTTGAVLGKRALPEPVVSQVRELMASQDILVIAMRDGQGYLQSGDLDHLDQFGMGRYRQLYLDTAELVDQMDQVLQLGDLEKINLYFASVDARDAYVKQLDCSAIAPVTSEQTGLELTAVGADKGQGLTSLCQVLGLTMSQVIAVGDADNDRTMLINAGLGLVMGNAKPAIKALADQVLPSNDEGGCAVAIERYLLD